MAHTSSASLLRVLDWLKDGRWLVGSALLPLILFAVTLLQVWSLPHNLGDADEGIFLYQAKRIADGEVAYRDFFYFGAPAGWYIMALLYKIFGADMGTARTANAVLHAGIAVLTFQVCRAIGVRPGLALVAGLAPVAISQPAWPFTSPHWLSTFWTQLLVLVLLRAPRGRLNRWLIVAGVISGALIATQQQRGLVIAAGVYAALVLAWTLDQRFSSPQSFRSMLRGVWCFSVGVSVVVPVGLFLVATAGVWPVYEALFEFPLSRYIAAHTARWGAVLILNRDLAGFTFPTLLKYLPVTLLFPLVRGAWCWWSKSGRAELWPWTVLTAICVSSILSIQYVPDFIHIAFITPPFFVVLAAAVDGFFRRLDALRRAGRVAGWVTTAVALSLLAVQLQRTGEQARRRYPIAAETQFGLVHFVNGDMPAFLDAFRAVMHDAPTRDLYCYPVSGTINLMTGTRNPTPYDHFLPVLRTPEQVQRALAMLDQRRPEYAIFLRLFVLPTDPIRIYLSEHYSQSEDPRLAKFPILQRRRDPRPAQDHDSSAVDHGSGSLRDENEQGASH